MYMARKTSKRHSRRSASKKIGNFGLNSTLKNVKSIGKTVGKKSVSGVKQGVSGIYGFLKSGLGLAFDTAKQGVKQGESLLSMKSRKHRRKSRKH